MELNNFSISAATTLTLFVLTLAICYVHLSSVSAQDSHCSSTKREFYGATNQALEISAYEEANVKNAVICGRNCHADPRCKSFNYHKCSRVCELNNNTIFQHRGDLVETSGSVYFDFSQDTRLSSVEYPDNRYCSCKKILEAGYNQSGVYTIYPSAYGDGLQVHCDMDTVGGGWITIQRRQDGSEDFYRNWTEYEAGFGNFSGEFWLGNTPIQDVAASGGPWLLRLDMKDKDGVAVWAEYVGFQLLGESYKLSYQSYNSDSTAGDSLWLNRNLAFQTKDNAALCPSYCRGAWWYGLCGNANLNGVYYRQGVDPYDPLQAIYWKAWKDVMYWSYWGLKECSMKISEI